ncbi:hypothetical protein BX600DRAFT_474772 [Xylariales sp. PMI_506]|nr:hypothetical protein BX600DRAFT_474772 [Xylariales sp. PMI_506]
MSKYYYSDTNQYGPILQAQEAYDEPQATITTTPAPPEKGVYRLEGSIRWYLIINILYTLAAIGGTVYILYCPRPSPGYRVLVSSDLQVSQFYAGIALSLILTPAAIVIRQISHEFALLQPFAIASQKPVTLSDLDRLMDPGLSAAARLFRYAPWSGFVQALLMLAGAVLVPVGTLTVYTGTYSAPVVGTAVVGMPTASGTVMTLSGFAGPFFINNSVSMIVGNLLAQTGVVPETPPRLGPSSTVNLTYQDSVRYSGIVTYTWESACEYTDEITFYESPNSLGTSIHISFPSGETCAQLVAGGTGGLCVHQTTGNDTTFYAVSGATQNTVNVESALAASAIVAPSNDTWWLSRVACTPSITSHVSACTWDATQGSMRDCQDEPGSNTTALDDIGIHGLGQTLVSLPFAVYDTGLNLLGLNALEASFMFYSGATNDSQSRAPELADYTNMYGMFARSLATLSTSGYYGVAEVLTLGSVPQPAYFVREYVLAIVLALIVLPSLLCCATLARWVWVQARRRHRRHRLRVSSALLQNGTPQEQVQQHQPPAIMFRIASFLTVAAATRGLWWDAVMRGEHTRSHRDLKARHDSVVVMFGPEIESPYVGFTPNPGTAAANTTDASY